VDGCNQTGNTERGYTAYRVDEEPHSDNIIFRIMAEIKNSRFVVADVTEQKNGVYFEAGYALGLGLPVIWTVRKDDAKNVHFDTAQYNHDTLGVSQRTPRGSV
jgi:nucleoside 2-deoxyribosyltransferase